MSCITTLLYTITIYQATTAEEVTSSFIPLAIGMFLVLIVFVIIMYNTFRKQQIILSKQASIFAAMIVINNINNKNLVKTSLSLRIFLFAISDYLRKDTLSIGGKLYAPKDFVGYDPSAILNRNIPFYIHTKCHLNNLKFRINNIIYSLIGNIDDCYSPISDLLIWLEQDTKNIGELKTKFTERYPLLIQIIILSLGALLFPVILKILDVLLAPNG